MTKCLQCDPEQCRYWRNKKANVTGMSNTNNLDEMLFLSNYGSLICCVLQLYFSESLLKIAIDWSDCKAMESRAKWPTNCHLDTFGLWNMKYYPGKFVQLLLGSDHCFKKFHSWLTPHHFKFNTFAHLQEIWWPKKDMMRFRQSSKLF